MESRLRAAGFRNYERVDAVNGRNLTIDDVKRVVAEDSLAHLGKHPQRIGISTPCLCTAACLETPGCARARGVWQAIGCHLGLKSRVALARARVLAEELKDLRTLGAVACFLSHLSAWQVCVHVPHISMLEECASRCCSLAVSRCCSLARLLLLLLSRCFSLSLSLSHALSLSLSRSYSLSHFLSRSLPPTRSLSHSLSPSALSFSLALTL